MRIRVLGSAAGGGFPQWNCGCPNCAAVRAGDDRLSARTQECLAVTGDGEAWFLLNASPEIRSQIESFPPLHPSSPRGSPIAGIVLTSGDLDHCLGLLSLRESQPLVVYATSAVRRSFCEGNRLYRTLERFDGQVRWCALQPGRSYDLAAGARPAGLALEVTVVPGKPPLHAEDLLPPSAGDNVAVRLTDTSTGAVLAYAPAVGRLSRAVPKVLDGAHFVFFDGTFWSDDELVRLGLGTRRAEQMAHVPVGGPDGSLEALAALRAGRRLFIHINNTNPMLRSDSEERRTVEAAGWELAYDGMELTG